MKVKDRINALRERMRLEGLQAYLVPSGDNHQSEYVPLHWRRREWISGFTGSAGDVLITMDEAGLWTDGRYFLQAAKELKGSGIKLHRSGEPGVPTVDEFLGQTLRARQVVGFDPRVVSKHRAATLRDVLKPQRALYKPVDENLVDAIWEDRPAPSKEIIEALSPDTTGEATTAKLKRVRKEMQLKGADALVVTLLDEIAWLFNIRGSDVEFNPVAIAYAIVTQKTAELFIDPRKVPAAVARKLGTRVKVQEYDGIAGACRALGKKRLRVWADSKSTSVWIAQLLDGCTFISDATPIGLMKAKKNATETKGMRAAHVRDGVAMVRFLHWLSKEVKKGRVTERSAAQRLLAYRAEGDAFRGPSFDTISGYGSHGAIVHYRVDEKSDVPLEADGLYLVDSGGHYTDGTTDITRTVLLGPRPTREQKEIFTRVLKGHIGLAMASFPEGTTGARLDVIARTALWQLGLDYNHGTGHGVGSFLNVHEGPQSIGPKGSDVPLEVGNVLSNEPGYYEPGAYGMRVENLLLVVKDDKRSKNGKPFLSFETLSFCPIDTSLVERKLLTEDERAWLNEYHRDVQRTLSPHLGTEEKKWLKAACAAL